MKNAEVLFVILLVVGMLVPSALAGQWWLFSVFIVFFFCFGLIEWLAVKKTGKSVSQKFWKFSEEHRWGAIGVLAGMLIAWLALLWHLATKLFS